MIAGRWALSNYVDIECLSTVMLNQGATAPWSTPRSFQQYHAVLTLLDDKINLDILIMNPLCQSHTNLL